MSIAICLQLVQQLGFGRSAYMLTGDHEVIASRERSRTRKDRLML